MIINVGDTCSFGGVTLGQTDAYGAEAYFTGLDGWGAPKSTVQITQRAAGDGGFASPAFLQARHFTVMGALIASTRPELEAAFDRLQAAASIGIQPVIVTSGGAVRYALAQREDEIVVTDESDIHRAFTITFVAADPRKFGADVTASTLLPSGSGDWTFPFTLPFSIDSTVISGLCALTNPGSLIGSVKLRIDGPVGGPVVTHIGSGKQLVFASSYVLGSGNWLDIDMDAHTVLENGQAERNGFVTSRGWSGFDPGENVWAFTANAYNPTAKLSVIGTPAWP